ncbi:MAG: hypothetical protein U0166_20940 [Acidobacteriota bacterium]
MILSDSAVQQILKDLYSNMNQVWQMAFAAWVAVAALQLMVGAIGWKVANRIIWPAFVYPIIGLALLKGYQDVMWGLVDVPQEIGWDMAAQGLDSAIQSISDTAAKWGDPGGGWLQLIFETVWSLEIKLAMVGSLIFSLGMFGLLQMIQIAIIGVLYVLGPVFCLAASFKGTASFTARWATSVVEVSSWTVVWGVLLKAHITLDNTIGNEIPDPTNPATIMTTIQRISIMYMYGLLTIAVPLISRALVGGGIGVAVAGAATAAMSIGTSIAAKEMSSDSKGGGSGGSGSGKGDGDGPDTASDPRSGNDLAEAA